MIKFFMILGFILPVFAGGNASGDYMLFVGNYTQNDSQGIDVYRFNAETAELAFINTIRGVKNPSYITLSADGAFLYAVEELTRSQDREGGRISAFKITDLKRGRARKLNTVSSAGEAPCYITFDTGGQNLLVANYLGGRVGVWPLRSDGSIDENPLLYTASPAEEQSHMHCIRPAGDSGLLLASDLGRDALYLLRPDNQNVLKQHALLKLPAGNGPRHFDFYADGTFLYVGNEMGNTVSFFRATDQKNGMYQYVADYNSLPEGFSGKSWIGDIHVHPRLPYLYVSNRGHNSLARFKIEPEGHLILKDATDVGGNYPRNFILDNTGNFLLAAHQKSASISVFRVNPVDGALKKIKTIKTAASPVCLKLFPINN